MASALKLVNILGIIVPVLEQAIMESTVKQLAPNKMEVRTKQNIRYPALRYRGHPCNACLHPTLCHRQNERTIIVAEISNNVPYLQSSFMPKFCYKNIFVFYLLLKNAFVSGGRRSVCTDKAGRMSKICTIFLCNECNICT